MKLLLLLGAARMLWAHPGEPLAPHDLWTAWSFDPAIVISLLLTAALFHRGSSRTVAWRVRCFWTGWCLLAYALISPLHALGERLFSAHMVQHEVLMVMAAPLLVLSQPMVPMLWGFPLRWRRAMGQWGKALVLRRIWSACTHPLGAWVIHAAALWLWHIPSWFESTLISDWAHAAQHASFLFSALLFWWSVFEQRSDYGISVLSLFTTATHTSILGALLTLSPRVWYSGYDDTARWGLTALEDQQLGGLIMWVPATIVYVAAALGCMAQWLRRSRAAS
jgi:putative membrane protein